MGKITVNAPIDKVFKAVSDLTRHAGWAAYKIAITAEQEGPIGFGNIYSSGKRGHRLDRITVTEYEPNDRFGFRVVMPNKSQVDWLITLTPEADGTRVEWKGRSSKVPWRQAPKFLLGATVGTRFERKLAKNMKADLEKAA